MCVLGGGVEVREGIEKKKNLWKTRIALKKTKYGKRWLYHVGDIQAWAPDRDKDAEGPRI